MKKNLKSVAVFVVFLSALFAYDSFSQDKQTTQAKDNRGDLYGFWVSLDSYIVISNSSGEMKLKEYFTNESAKEHGKFKLTSSNENSFEAQFLDSGENFFLEFSDTKRDLTLTKNNKEVTFKYTDVTPEDYIAGYN